LPDFSGYHFTVLKRTIKFLSRWLLKLAIAAALILGIPRLGVEIYARTRTHAVTDSPEAPVAIVFGAGLDRSGFPSPVLQDRVSIAADLYFAGKVKKLLMSGDNRFIDYNEPGAMQKYALLLGVPEGDIVLDYAGRRTYDTCYRARAIFGVRQAVVVTQDFHLPRALLLCNAMGIQATGASASRRSYGARPEIYWQIRELPAIVVSFWEIWVTHPLPVLGSPEPIFASDIPTPPFQQ
jgi:SanA protein